MHLKLNKEDMLNPSVTLSLADEHVHWCLCPANAGTEPLCPHSVQKTTFDYFWKN